MSDKKDEKDCGCVKLRWRLFLTVLFGLVFGIIGGEMGGALAHTAGMWFGAVIGAAAGGWIGFNVNAKNFEDMFFWVRKGFWSKKK